jgi:hypothetical protein
MLMRTQSGVAEQPIKRLDLHSAMGAAHEKPSGDGCMHHWNSGDRHVFLFSTFQIQLVRR